MNGGMRKNIKEVYLIVRQSSVFSPFLLFFRVVLCKIARKQHFTYQSVPRSAENKGKQPRTSIPKSSSPPSPFSAPFFSGNNHLPVQLTGDHLRRELLPIFMLSN
jgi:hypothetical protein